MGAEVINRCVKRRVETERRSLNYRCLCRNGGSLVFTTVLSQQWTLVSITAIGGFTLDHKLWSEYVQVLVDACFFIIWKVPFSIKAWVFCFLSSETLLPPLGIDSPGQDLPLVIILLLMQSLQSPASTVSPTWSADDGLINGLTNEDRNVHRLWFIWTTTFSTSI